MIEIEIDDDVYKSLKELAEPFVDTPNDVLRRLLLKETNTSSLVMKTKVVSLSTSQKNVISSARFMSSFLKNRYGGIFSKVLPYRTMFESDAFLILFRNFNKADTANLWYRIENEALQILRKSMKKVFICFTNPAEGIVIEVPLVEIDLQAKRVSWSRNYYEVNIEPDSLFWRELNWDLQKYRVNEGI